ncbi:hypothetical protein HELRODRAFT_182831 [Helobdella robusta]|uniref:Zinc finger PHD-type domain-containing protein n=1 Tax=Helobdella robusta TaxID=6412 RepID=T1FIT8_HELRO|nr:hypothetical protein HELRODRAFT_182831 [Helobdella robusta]ESN90134.1 hypothetical protein HELRODRAFT_182831 [Helobdella robusta]
MAEKNKCQTCNKVTGAKDILHCRFCCSAAVHWRCIGMSDSTMKELQQPNNFVWMCNSCIGQIELFRLNSQLNEMSVEIRKLQESNAKISDQVNYIQDKLDSGEIDNNFGDKITTLQENLKKSYADTLKDVVVADVVKVNNRVTNMNDGIQALKVEVIKTKETIQSISEIEERSCNLIIFRLKENVDLSVSDGRREDDENISRILGTILKDKVDKFDVVKQFRLGKKTEKTRPLLVRLKSKSLKNLIMENLSNLKNLDEDLRGISVGHDLTKEQRNDCKKLIETAREKDKDRADKQDFVYRVTGELGNWRIRRLPKKSTFAISILSKFNVIFGLISEGLDIFVVAETWHGSSDSLSVGLSLPPGYRFIDAVRAGDPFHGGLIIFLGPSCKYRRIVVPTVTTFEVLAVKLIIDRQDFILLAVYRPGSVQPLVLFFKELTVVLDSITVLNSRIVLAGDFNIHVERGSDTHAATLGDIFENYCLVNHTKEPTHILGGTLDLVVTSVDFPVIDCSVHPSGNILEQHVQTCVARSATGLTFTLISSS